MSFGADQLGDPGLFSDILRDQLNVDAAEFWRVVDQKVPAQRPTPVVPEPARVLPAWLVSGLIKEGVLESHIATLDEDAARALLNDLRSQERR